MKTPWLLGLATATLAVPLGAWAQRPERKSEAEFVASRPAVGDALPEVVVYDISGEEVPTATLRGHHTVLTFGCLT